MRFEPPSAAEMAWNPYSWRLRQLARLSDDHRYEAWCQRMREELLVTEADEVARGIRHVSVVFGVPENEHRAAQVETFLGEVDKWLDGASWSRVRGGRDHVIIAAGGPDAGNRIATITGLAQFANPGHWAVTDGPRPHLG